MNYGLLFTKEFTKVFEKLLKKNKKQAEIVLKKIREVKENPTHYKPLSNKLKGYWRVHVDSSFVVVFALKGNYIIIYDYDHHDNIYDKNFNTYSFQNSPQQTI